MSDRALRRTMAAGALVTGGIGIYLLQAHYTGDPVVCSTGGCAAVEDSRYADVFGVPVALIGVLGSAAILVSLTVPGVNGRAMGLAATGAGLLFAAYLVAVQLTVLGAVCEWCIANDALVAGLAVLAAWRARADLRSAADA